MVTIFYTLVISVIIARKYVLRDTGDTTRLKNADTLFDGIDTILSVSQMRYNVLPNNYYSDTISVDSPDPPGVPADTGGGGNRHSSAGGL